MLENEKTLTGFGASTPHEVDELHKALSVGYEYSTTLPASFTGAAALQVESLDKTLRLVTYQMKNLLLWQDIPKQQAFNTVEEYNTQNSYGESIPAFFTMGNAPSAADSGYDRSTLLIKYIGTQKQINHNVMLVRQAHGPIVQREIKSGAMWILGQTERALFSADSSINTLEFDGVDYLIRSRTATAKYRAQSFVGYDGYADDANCIIDSRNTSQSGSVLSEENLEEAGLIAANNFGMPTDLYLDTKAHSDFSRAFYAKERINALGSEGKAGYVVRQFVSGAGAFNLKSGVFMRPRRTPLSVAVSATAAPTIANGATPADGSSEFISTDAGAYYYTCSSVYADGETVDTAGSTVTVAAGDKVTFEINYTGSPLYFNIFRSALAAANATEVEYIGRVTPGGTGVAHDFDYNYYMPGLSKAYLLQVNEDNICFKQLLTMMKIDLALTDTAFKWMQLLYGSPLIFTPRKNVIIENIGRN